MKDSIAVVQQDEFGNIEKKYSKAAGSCSTKRPKIRIPATAGTEPDESIDDENFCSQDMSSESSSEASMEIDEVSNSEVH